MCIFIGQLNLFMFLLQVPLENTGKAHQNVFVCITFCRCICTDIVLVSHVLCMWRYAIYPSNGPKITSLHEFQTGLVNNCKMTKYSRDVRYQLTSGYSGGIKAFSLGIINHCIYFWYELKVGEGAEPGPIAAIWPYNGRTEGLP